MACLRTIIFTALLLVPGCGPDSGDETSGTSGTGGGTSSSGDGSSGDVPTTGSTGGASTGDASTGDASTGDTSSGGTTGDSSGDSGTVDPLCSLEHWACELAASNGEYEDCGSVTLSDDVMTWQVARECALKAAGEQRAFKIITQLQGFDSLVGEAYASVVGRSFGVSRFNFDDDPCGGEGCGPVVMNGSCEALVATPNCTVAPGQACLTCTEPGPVAQVCGPA